ncbi:hypothetical protein [uncultured Chryseobacterium sp.]|uniref:hypothetical protein n=1 Tax=uncultured Chryseobacterium sp. TaxID=259322 RepID=UPI0025D2E22E|nr:hypothetical protein [uncultured Chryseobacterium sp.]
MNTTTTMMMEKMTIMTTKTITEAVAEEAAAAETCKGTAREDLLREATEVASVEDQEEDLTPEGQVSVEEEEGPHPQETETQEEVLHR